MFAKSIGVEPKYSVLPVWMMGVLGIFIPILGELKEMCYQYDRDYFFDSTKFENRFGLKPTPVDIAIRETVNSYQ